MTKQLQDKIKDQVKFNGIKTVAYSQDDMKKYTHDEVELLYMHGYISSAMKNTEYLRRGL